MDSGLCLPQWFLDHIMIKEDGEKPETFARVRFWQTSKNFYTSKSVSIPSTSEPRSSFRPRTVREVLEERVSSVLVIARDRLGNYVKSTRVRLAVDWNGFSRFHSWDTEHRAAATLSFRSFFCSYETVKNKLIEKYESCKLQQLQAQNKVTLHQALRFRAMRKDRMTC